MSLKRNAILILLISLSSLTISAMFFFTLDTFHTNKSNIISTYSNTNYSEQEYKQIQDVVSKPKDSNELITSGWIPDWDLLDGFETLKAQNDKFKSISPVWFWVNSNGSLDVKSGANNSEFISYCKQNEVELIPTISLFDADILHSILNSKENTQKHIAEIVFQVNTNNYEGIDLDYESTYISDKQNLIEFLIDLDSELDKTNKRLVFTVMPKWGDFVDYSSLPQTRRVQDYTRIAEIVDEFRIMTYEFSGRSSNQVAPIAPIQWMEDVVKYAIYKDVPREKIMLGIHNYAYDYEDRGVAEHIQEGFKYVSFEVKEPSAAALFGTQVQKIKDNYSYTQEYRSDWEEMLLFYEFQGINRVVIYPNQDAIEAREDLAAKYGLKGVVYWRIGDDGGIDY